MTTKTSRQIALERRIAMSDGGKKSLSKSSTRQDRVRSASDVKVNTATAVNKSSVVTKITKTHKKNTLPSKILNYNQTVFSREFAHMKVI